MKRLLVALAAGSVLSGCPSKRSAAVDGGAPAPEATAAAVTADGGAYLVRADVLDRYIRYQERALSLYAALLDDLAKLERADAGQAGRQPVALFKQHADALEHLRNELGLSERDVEALDQMVGDVISRRAVAPAAEQLESIQRMEALAAELPADSREEFDKTLASLKAKLSVQTPLSEERRKYGDANVDVILSREADLTRQWNQAISTFAGARR